MKRIITTILSLSCASILISQTPSGLARSSDIPFIEGWRFIQVNIDNHGFLGKEAVDLSIQLNPSSTSGAAGEYSLASGSSTTASGDYSTATGRLTQALGENSMTMGFGTVASGNGTFSIGHFNTIDGSANPSDFSLTNRALVIGNGNLINRSDAMTVWYDGNTTIAGELTVNSDARLKTNITSLGSTLSLLQLLDGKTYALKHDIFTEKIGLLAQDVQRIFPQLVRKAGDKNGTLSVNYQGLIPVLINAVNEQQQQIEMQQEQIEQLTEMITSFITDQ